MMSVAFLTDLRKGNRSAMGRHLPGLSPVMLPLLLAVGMLAWKLAIPSIALLLGGLIFSLGLLMGRELGRRASRTAKLTSSAAGQAQPARYSSGQAQEIRCNPFFELL